MTGRKWEGLLYAEFEQNRKGCLWDTRILKATSLLVHFSIDSRVRSPFFWCQIEKIEIGDEISCFVHTSPTEFSIPTPVFFIINVK